MTVFFSGWHTGSNMLPGYPLNCEANFAPYVGSVLVKIIIVSFVMMMKFVASHFVTFIIL